MRDGEGIDAAEAAAAQVMKGDQYGITLRIGRGRGRAHYHFCDVGHAYVTVNADYRT